MHVTLLSVDFLDTNNACSLSFSFALHDLVPFPELETPSELLACSNNADMSRFHRLTPSVLGTLADSKASTVAAWF